jgi:hypothetical protein
MLVRSVFVWLGSSLLLSWLSFATQAEEFRALYLVYAAFFTVPIAVSVYRYRGALGSLCHSTPSLRRAWLQKSNS